MTAPRFTYHPDALAATALAPLILYAAQSRHAVTDNPTRANRIGGTKFLRQQMQQYLCADATKRVEPRLGVGLLLAEVTAELVISGVLERTDNGWKTMLDTKEPKK